MKLVFNGVKPKETKLHLPDWRVEDFPKTSWKYAPLAKVYEETSDLVRTIIDQIPLVGGYKRTLVDVKVQDLTPDFFSCIEGWHVDGMPPTAEGPNDVHHLVVLNGPCTEFVGVPVEIDMSLLPERFTNEHLDAQVPKDVPFYAVKEGYVTTFTSLDFHRGVKATTPTRRLLVRVTETSGIMPNMKPRDPSHGAVKW